MQRIPAPPPLAATLKHKHAERLAASGRNAQPGRRGAAQSEAKRRGRKGEAVGRGEPGSTRVPMCLRHSVH